MYRAFINAPFSATQQFKTRTLEDVWGRSGEQGGVTTVKNLNLFN